MFVHPQILGGSHRMSGLIVQSFNRPLKRDHSKRKGSSSKHHFSGADLLVFGGVYQLQWVD